MLSAQCFLFIFLFGSDNAERRDNQQERLLKDMTQKIPPEKGYYIAGFVDGEGSFYLTARRRKDYSSGWKFSAHFSLGNRDLSVLHVCKKYLRCGTIRETGGGFFVLEVADRKKLQEFLVPFFDRFQFLSNKKRAEFRFFQEALSLLENPISSSNQLKKLLALRCQLNQYRKVRAKNSDEIILESFVFLEESSETNTLNNNTNC